ncbi:MAG TPA: tRNA (N6-threonylcarbamoyladenosine(37)-N6)-methyltransferase TrmO [Acidimicrobiia bacterium]|nr:tRNA (N6-threonylcarbamoyladenosine(37)-N6)-methyltransferase TrmO [Acidimicrobiia bacterium]
MADPGYVVHPIGWVESPLVDPDAAPNQGDEGAPDAWLVLDPSLRLAVRDLEVGAEAIVLTWLDRADRDTLVVHPRGDPNRPPTGVFSTRSQDRPNPIGLHTVEIMAIEDTRIQVRRLEAVDRTPVIDIKPVLGSVEER